jgi:hypothetical protein
VSRGVDRMPTNCPGCREILTELDALRDMESRPRVYRRSESQLRFERDAGLVASRLCSSAGRRSQPDAR